MSEPKITDADFLARLADLCVEDIMATSSEDLRGEMIEDGEDPDQVASRMRALIREVIEAHRQRRAECAAVPKTRRPIVRPSP